MRGGEIGKVSALSAVAILSFHLCGDASFHLVHVSVDDCHGGDVDHLSHAAAEVDEVDRLVESHLYRADDFHVGVHGLQHLVRRACAGEVREHECVDVLALELVERIHVVAHLLVECGAYLQFAVDKHRWVFLLQSCHGSAHFQCAFSVV